MGPILVIGGTGTVGSGVTKGLLARDVETRVFSRDPSRVAAGAQGVRGDLEKPETLAPALEGVERVFLLTPLHPREAEIGKGAVSAIAEAGVERVVLLSIHRVETVPEPPHFASKLSIEHAIRDHGLRYSVVSPGNYYQNDLRARDAILEHGVFPEPIGAKGCSRVDARDVSDAAVRLLLDEPPGGASWPVVGPDAWTEAGCAEVWSKALGREIRPIPSLDAWEGAARGAGLPDWLVTDLRLMYELFRERGLPADDEDLARCREILGRDPRGYGEFVAETAEAWTASA